LGVVFVALGVTPTTWAAEYSTTRPDDSSPFLIRNRAVPREYQKAFEFLEFIKYPAPPLGFFKAKDAPRWNVRCDYLQFEGD